MIRVLVVDDQVLFAQSLQLVITTITDDIEVVGVAFSGHEAIEKAVELTPDIILMDVRMGNVDGVDAAQAILAKDPTKKIMMLTTFDDDAYVQEAVRAGAAGYILKDIPPDELVASIRALHAGTAQFSPDIVRRVAAGAGRSTPNRNKDTPFCALTQREVEICVLIGLGLENAEIATRLFVSERTVKNHVSTIYGKLGIHNRTKVARLAMRHGLA